MKRKLRILLMALLLGPAVLYAQNFSTGLVPLPVPLQAGCSSAQPHGIITAENALPGDGVQTVSLPSSADLSAYLPPIGDQGPVGSCSAWSTIYYSKTLQENLERGWGADDTNEIFSPLFIYNQITGGRNVGTSIEDHMALAVERGCPTLATFPETRNLNARPSTAALQEAARYKADSFDQISEYDYETGTFVIDINKVKTALASGYPVVAGINIYSNFYDYAGGIYSRASGSALGGHAMCIVGYDDSRGVLKIVNSWGEGWGDVGFVYFPYDLFSRYANGGGGILYDHRGSTPTEAYPPNNVEASKGTFSSGIRLTWTAVENTKEYIVYKSDNGSGTLKEYRRVTGTEFTDQPLPQGVSYIYALRSVNTLGKISDFSQISEGSTGSESPAEKPGIPGNFQYSYDGSTAVFTWDTVSNADRYILYRWSGSRNNWIEYGQTGDNTFADDRINTWEDTPFAYYIVSALNRGGESYAAGFVSIPLDRTASERDPAEREEKPDIAGNWKDNYGMEVRIDRDTADRFRARVYKDRNVAYSLILERSTTRGEENNFSYTWYKGEWQSTAGTGFMKFNIVDASLTLQGQWKYKDDTQWRGEWNFQKPRDSVSAFQYSALPYEREELARMAEDDSDVDKARARDFRGDFYSIDYFDYETTMTRFREFHEAEQKAFQDWKKREEDAFEAWKARDRGWKN